MIKYDKIIKILEGMGMTNSYKVKQTNIIGQATYHKLKNGGIIDTRTINRLCKLFECQPGDLLYYVPDEEPAAEDEQDDTSNKED